MIAALVVGAIGVFGEIPFETVLKGVVNEGQVSALRDNSKRTR